MCPPAIVGALSFLAPKVLPMVLESVFNKRTTGQQGPTTHQEGLLSKVARKAPGPDENISLKDEDGIGKQERTAQAKASLRRKMRGQKNLGSKAAPGTGAITDSLPTAPVGGVTV